MSQDTTTTTSQTGSLEPMATTAGTELVPVAVPQETTVFTESEFSPAEWGRVGELAAAVDATDSNLLLSYGSKPQMDVSSVLDTLLREMNTEDADVGGDLLIALSRGMEEAKIREMRDELKAGGSTLAYTFNQIPLIGPWIARQMSAFLYFKHSKDKIIKHFDEIEKQIMVHREKLVKANTKLDMNYEATANNLEDLKVYIAAGEQAGQRLVEEANGRLAEARESRDAVVVNQYRDFRANVESFLTRVVRLHMAYTNAAQNLPQIRQIQETTKIALSDVVDTLLVDMPQMKQAILQLSALKSIRDARTASEKRREISRELRELASNAASDSYLEAKQSQGAFEEELQLLERMATKLKETEQRAREIEAQNQAARKDAHARMQVVVKQLADVQLQA
ncbi:toxic anion resistance protein [uncultured Cohaesibacter sp.]|uniref:toxic anion resistance protein n=1 Tax=uncultured Cohaesibacter sp. TaxID=1002546 RepID=UPI0029303543|nr:toxic anion resistance protein [uncultured Cohaesibacter sp.]